MPGVRLLEPVATNAPAWFTSIPPAFQPASRQWLVLPLSAVFGSDELSNRSPAIAERIAQPFLSLHPSDGARLSLVNDSTIDLAWQGLSYSLAVRFESSTPVGTAGLSLVPEVAGVGVPAWIDLLEAIKTERKQRAA
jgi:NADH-quinone oxidoreductase subunit G